ncbi:expressed unknown protein [Seminavis robusta]|uniref:Uncharacterized protein n=1 Tax=Seminavis robusta TaxID=568900 RepID=A0A9N8D5I9_9STRA|nr:expressed unknown protein [Seminavis robusta]|eukprot:Sro9_g007690.1 n/a (435) ;mRNA; f:220325-221629
MSGYDQQRNGHLEDFDSAQGDVEASLGATISGSTRIRSGFLTVLNDNTTVYDESIRRGVLNAQTQPNDETEKSPGAFMDAVFDGGGHSVTTGRMDYMMDRGHNSIPPTQDIGQFYDDTYTYDGSTITSANDITHKKNTHEQHVVDFNPQAAAAAAAASRYPYHAQPAQQEKLRMAHAKETEFTSVSSKTASSSRSNKSEQSQVAKICFGLGKLGLVLTLLAILAVAIAVILFLVLGNDQSVPPPPSSACCHGQFEAGWSGREICNPQGGCCVVCSSSIIASDSSANIGDSTSTTAPQIDTPTRSPTASPEENPNTRAPGSDSQRKTPAPSEPSTVAPEKTPLPTASTPEPTVSPTDAPSPFPSSSPSRRTRPPAFPPTSPPTAAPTYIRIVAATIPPHPKQPCCSNGRRAGDYIGLVRCANNDPTACCEVCYLN